MKIIDPRVEIITESNPLKRIELCGRVCYKSEDKITPDSARKFVENIIRRGHTSVLEHGRVNVLCPPHGSGVESAMIYGLINRMEETGDGGMAMNARDFIAIGGTIDDLATLKNADDYMTVRFVCDRGISHELVRHRVFSFSQESTRYVNYMNREMEFIRPLPFKWAELDMRNDAGDIFTYTCDYIEKSYCRMIEGGCTPQEARSVLPNSLKTELVMTGTFDQWRAMLKLRLSPAAHPQMRYLMEILVEKSGIQATE